MENLEPTQRQKDLAKLAARVEFATPIFRVRESPEFLAQRDALMSVPGALDYLPAIRAALECGLKIPGPFNDHGLIGAAAAYRSVIVGEIDDGDPTFVLIYRVKRPVLRFLFIDQHDGAYERLEQR